jgi:hypothetical protein
MYSGDADQRPHFHAEKMGEWQIRIFFLECTDNHLEFEYIYVRKKISRTARRIVLGSIIAYRGELLKEWEGRKKG